MTTTQITGLHWRRGCEDRYDIQMESSLVWGTWTLNNNGALLSGSVVTVKPATLNEIVKADSTVQNGRFRGILFSEVSSDLDDTLSGAPPAICASSGNGLILIRNTVLNRTLDYSANNGFVKAGTGPNAGLIVPYGGEPAAGAKDVVGKVQEIYTDSVLLHLFPATI